MSGLRRIVLIGAVLGVGVGGAKLQAQTQLADPKDAPRIFASTCSACHKSPQGLAKSGQVAGFLRQHYTTGPEMSAAMAAYLVSAGSAPPSKKGAATAEAAAAKDQKDRPTKGKKQEHASATPGSDQPDPRTLRGKQRQTKSSDEAPAAQSPAPPASATQPPEPVRQAAVPAAAPEPAPAAPAPEAGPPPVVFDVPVPEMPVAPPADLTPQSVFSSSPLP